MAAAPAQSSAPAPNRNPIVVPPPFEVNLGPPTTEAEFLEAAKQSPCTDWSQFWIFNSEKKLLYAPLPLPEADIEFYLFVSILNSSTLLFFLRFITTKLETSDSAFSNGIIINIIHYDVHKFELFYFI